MRALLVFLLLLSTQFANAITPELQKLVDFETHANAASARSNQPIILEHYEIPLRLMEKSISKYADPEAVNALIFQKGGESYVRWFINPEDTKWHLEVEKWMTKNNLPIVRNKQFIGRQTASRSYVIEDPATGAQFFAKVSTNHTGGNWTDKKQEWSDAKDVKDMNDYVNSVFANYTPENFINLDEAMVLGIKDIDQGMIVRSVGALKTNAGTLYLPGFSALHETTGARIAALNGSNDPASFWNEHYNKPLAKALAELYATTGIYFDSPHSQNFLVELDKNQKPTGKIIIRDLGDTYINAEQVTLLSPKLAASWPKDNVLHNRMSVAVGELHGNKKPSWISEATYNKYGVDFYETFDNELSRLTGIPVSEIRGASTASGASPAPAMKFGRNGDYFARMMGTTSPGWNSFFKRIQANQKFVPAHISCNAVFSKTP